MQITANTDLVNLIFDPNYEQIQPLVLWYGFKPNAFEKLVLCIVVGLFTVQWISFNDCLISFWAIAIYRVSEVYLMSKYVETSVINKYA